MANPFPKKLGVKNAKSLFNHLESDEKNPHLFILFSRTGGSFALSGMLGVYRSVYWFMTGFPYWVVIRPMKQVSIIPWNQSDFAFSTARISHVSPTILLI